MFPAPPLPRGRDLNEVERESRRWPSQDPIQSIFGPPTPASQHIARDIKQQTPSVDISALFSMIDAQQAPPSPIRSEAASSVAVDDVKLQTDVGEEFDVPDDPPEIQPPPRPVKRAKSSKSASAKNKAATSVVNKATAES